MYGPLIENRSARGIVADQRKRSGLSDRTLKGDEEEPVAVRTPNGRIVRLAQPRRALADGVEHGLNVGRRVRDGAKNLAGRRLLLQRLSKMLLRLGQFASPLVELHFEVGCGGTATTCCRWRVAALGIRRAPVQRIRWFTACSGTPSPR